MNDENDQGAFDAAIAQAKQQWPRLANWDVKMSKGTGKDWSETYPPGEEGNPTPDNWHVQLRGNKPLTDPSSWPETLGLESLHWLQATDPTYQGFTEQFIKSMTPEQHASARQVYVKGLAESMAADQPQPYDLSPHSNMRSYDRFLRQVQAQEYIRGGGMFKTSDWTKGNKGGYTPEQMKLMQQINDYLKTPSKNTDPQSYVLSKLSNSGVAN